MALDVKVFLMGLAALFRLHTRLRLTKLLPVVEEPAPPDRQARR